MRRTFEIRDAAGEEFDEAADWYRVRFPILRDRFVQAVDESILATIQRPLAFPVVRGTKARRAVVDGFPFSIFFLIDGDHIAILSIFHDS